MSVPRDFFMRVGWNGHVTASVSEARAICPHCKTATTLTPRAHHGQNRNNRIELHLLFECNNAPCRRLIYIQTLIDVNHQILQPNEEFYMYPSRAIDARHPSIPMPIADDWEEAQKAMQAGAPKGAAVMFRRVLYSVLMDKGCKLFPLRDGLNDLIQGQRLPAIFDDWLPAIRDDGHDGAHPDRALQVSHENVSETMEYTSELLRFLYIEPYEFEQRKARNAASTTSVP
jgi:hypothetical protein